jgi:hypothetical protein
MPQYAGNFSTRSTSGPRHKSETGKEGLARRTRRARRIFKSYVQNLPSLDFPRACSLAMGAHTRAIAAKLI